MELYAALLSACLHVVNTSDRKVITAFIAGVRDNLCCEELEICEPSTVSELYALKDECARAEEGAVGPRNVRPRPPTIRCPLPGRMGRVSVLPSRSWWPSQDPRHQSTSKSSPMS
jgi:hypothetical protein